MARGPSSSRPDRRDDHPEPALRRLVEASGVWLIWWVACAALWMVLDDTTAVPELVDGAVAASIGATAATATMMRHPDRFAARRAWARRWWRPLVQFVADLPGLVATLATALRGGEREPGALREIPFRLEEDAATRNSQVALASLVGSFAANSVVVAVDESASVLLVHELRPSGGRAGADPLELG
jgi:multisubunit Na+/H+ antiporter MnhE subunit